MTEETKIQVFVDDVSTKPPQKVIYRCLVRANDIDEAMKIIKEGCPSAELITYNIFYPAKQMNLFNND